MFKSLTRKTIMYNQIDLVNRLQHNGAVAYKDFEGLLSESCSFYNITLAFLGNLRYNINFRTVKIALHLTMFTPNWFEIQILNAKHDQLRPVTRLL